MRASSAALGLVLFACVPPPPDRSTGSTPEPDPRVPVTPPPSPAVTLLGLSTNPSKLSALPGQEISIALLGRYSDGRQVDHTTEAAWSSSDPALLAPVGGQPGRFLAVAVGDVEVRARRGDLEAASAVTIADAPRTPLELRLDPATLTLAVGESAQLAARLRYSDGAEEDVTSAAAWSSSAPSAVSASAGLVRRLTAGAAQVEVSHLGLSARLDVAEGQGPCSYPSGPTAIRVGSTMPLVSWTGAYHADGSTFDFSLEDVHCSPEYADKTIIVFMLGAAWCGPCTEYTRDLNRIAASVESAGGLIVYVEAETTSYSPASSQYAYEHIRNIIQSGPGIRVGDGDTEPQATLFASSPLTTQFPTIFVVRKRDMKILTDQARWNSMLPFVQIARNPDLDWSDPNNPPTVSNCGAGDEEAGEPNDLPASATSLAAGAIMGGVCNGQPDFFRVTHAGSWRFDLAFTHAVGDLDVFVWNEQTDQPLSVGGRQVGSDSGDDDESFMHSGPALVKVYGYRSASAPYTLTLTTF